MSYETKPDAPILIAVPDEWRNELVDHLTQLGYKLTTASTRDAANKIIQSESISGLIIVSEWAIASDDGRIPGLISQFKGKTPSITLVRGGNREIAKVYHPPFHDFCTMPFTIEELIGRMKLTGMVPPLD